MNKFNPKKLTVELRRGVTYTNPIIPRHYTLTHSDLTADILLTIGSNFALEKISAKRDEVFAEWVQKENQYLFYVYLNVDGITNNFDLATKRMEIFRRELPLALESIRYGDNIFFSIHPFLDYSPITVFFVSTYPQLNKIERWGTFSDYYIDFYA